MKRELIIIIIYKYKEYMFLAYLYIMMPQIISSLSIPAYDNLLTDFQTFYTTLFSFPTSSNLSILNSNAPFTRT